MFFISFPRGLTIMRMKLMPEPVKGDSRIISWFAFLPVEIKLERRWLERVTVEQMFHIRYTKSGSILDWCNIKFCDSKEDNNVK